VTGQKDLKGEFGSSKFPCCETKLPVCKCQIGLSRVKYEWRDVCLEEGAYLYIVITSQRGPNTALDIPVYVSLMFLQVIMHRTKRYSLAPLHGVLTIVILTYSLIRKPRARLDCRDRAIV
jgi:hypothetical protein